MKIDYHKFHPVILAGLVHYWDNHSAQYFRERNYKMAELCDANSANIQSIIDYKGTHNV
jgi:uncharacterized protein YaaW (UPF0174 family)